MDQVAQITVYVSRDVDVSPDAGCAKHHPTPIERELLELLHTIKRKVEHMEDVLAGLAADEAELATVVPRLVERDEAVSAKLADFEAKIANGEVVPAGEVATLKTGFDQSIASLKGLLPAEPPATPTNAVYTFTAGEGIVSDDRFSASGFETVPAEGAAAEPLYYFSGDSAAGETNGSTVPGYAVYTGATAIAPAA